MNTIGATSRTSSSCTVRAATAADAEGVFALLSQLGNNVLPVKEEFDELFHAYRAGDDSILLIAEGEGGIVLGYALLTVTGSLYTAARLAQLHELVVDSSATGRGIGTMLVAAAEAESQRRGARQLIVASLRAAMFYERLGYRSTSDFLKRTFD